MRRSSLAILMFVAGSAVPSAAYAADGATEAVTWAIGVVTLLASIALLLVAVGLARVADGSAMAENISYVVAGCVCLCAAVLAAWTVRFVSDPAVAEQIALGGSALDAVGIVLFCIYFYRVRSALRRFLKGVSGGQTPRVPEQVAAASEPGEGAGERE